jgi:hypothetical protein
MWWLIVSTGCVFGALLASRFLFPILLALSEPGLVFERWSERGYAGTAVDFVDVAILSLIWLGAFY